MFSRNQIASFLSKAYRREKKNKRKKISFLFKVRDTWRDFRKCFTWKCCCVQLFGYVSNYITNHVFYEGEHINLLWWRGFCVFGFVRQCCRKLMNIKLNRWAFVIIIIQSLGICQLVQMFVKIFEFRVIKLSSWLICRTDIDEVEIWFMWKDPIKLTLCNINDRGLHGEERERMKTIVYNTHLIWMSRQRITGIFCYFFYFIIIAFLFSYMLCTIFESQSPWRSIIVNIYDTLIIRRK